MIIVGTKDETKAPGTWQLVNNHKNQHRMGVCSIPVTGINSLHALIHLFLTTTMRYVLSLAPFIGGKSEDQGN